MANPMVVYMLHYVDEKSSVSLEAYGNVTHNT